LEGEGFAFGVGEGLLFGAFHFGTESGEFVVEVFVAAIDVIEAMDFGLAFGDESG
jgi:hypothetical protein